MSLPLDLYDPFGPRLDSDQRAALERRCATIRAKYTARREAQRVALVADIAAAVLQQKKPATSIVDDTDAASRLIATLEKDKDVTARLRAIFVGDATSPRQERKFMTVAEYAGHSRVSARTIRSYVASGMVEGEHFLREGRTGRRVIIHVEAADLWRASRRSAKDQERSIHDVAANDIARRRAVQVLKKTGGR